MHQVFRIDRVNGKLATPYTPPQDVEEKVFAVFPAEAADWVREDKIPQPPAEYSERIGPGSVADNVAVISPAPYEYVGQNVNIIGNARAGTFSSYKLAYGSSLQPSSFQQIGPDHGNQVTNGLLGVWDTTGLDGLYTLQLSVIESNGNFRQLQVPGLRRQCHADDQDHLSVYR